MTTPKPEPTNNAKWTNVVKAVMSIIASAIIIIGGCFGAYLAVASNMSVLQSNQDALRDNQEEMQVSLKALTECVSRIQEQGTMKLQQHVVLDDERQRITELRLVQVEAIAKRQEVIVTKLEYIESMIKEIRAKVGQ